MGAFRQRVSKSNHTCVYWFDAVSGLLERLTVKILTEAGEVTVAEFDKFTYSQPMADTLFAVAVAVPEDAAGLMAGWS